MCTAHQHLFHSNTLREKLTSSFCHDCGSLYVIDAVCCSGSIECCGLNPLHVTHQRSPEDSCGPLWDGCCTQLPSSSNAFWELHAQLVLIKEQCRYERHECVAWHMRDVLLSICSILVGDYQKSEIENQKSERSTYMSSYTSGFFSCANVYHLSLLMSIASFAFHRVLVKMCEITVSMSLTWLTCAITSCHWRRLWT